MSMDCDHVQKTKIMNDEENIDASKPVQAEDERA